MAQEKKLPEKTTFRLGLSDKIANPLLRTLGKGAECCLERLFYLTHFERQYKLISADDRDISFEEKILNFMNIAVNYRQDALDNIPATGPVIVVANHPFGGIEGIILSYLLNQRRPDCKIIANFILGRIVELRHNFLLVDPFETKQSISKNISSLRAATKHLKEGGLIATFPSGTVSHLQWDTRQVSDPAWNSNIAAMAKRTGASVVPIFFAGQNGPFFQAAGCVHPLLRTMLLPHELLNKSGKTISLEIGNIISPERVAEFSDTQELITYLRLRTYILGSRNHSKPKASLFRRKEKAPPQEKIISPVSQENIALEIAELPRTQVLFEKGKYQVFFANASQIPYLLREIGRLREVTFREVEEGSGKSIDIDRFDNYYKHLFLWNKDALEIIGAYRIIEADTVVNRYGVRGLYTHTLFDYGSKLLEQHGPSLELGRSFVRKEYQRDFYALQYLWTGIAQYVLRNPSYKILFGTVSISSEYDSVSRKLIMSFLEGNSFSTEVAKLIRPRNPFLAKPLKGVDSESTSRVVKDLQDVSELLKEIEAKHHHIPVLLKQYLKLGGKIVGFNTDKNFGNVLDGLVYVDLCETDQRVLRRYLGKEGLTQFLEFHKKSPASTSSTSSES